MSYQFHCVDDRQLIRFCFSFALLKFESEDFFRLQEHDGIVQSDGVDPAVVDGQQFVPCLDGSRPVSHGTRAHFGDNQVIGSVPEFWRCRVQ